VKCTRDGGIDGALGRATAAREAGPRAGCGKGRELGGRRGFSARGAGIGMGTEATCAAVGQ
jgi:hypothetical protein